MAFLTLLALRLLQYNLFSGKLVDKTKYFHLGGFFLFSVTHVTGSGGWDGHMKLLLQTLGQKKKKNGHIVSVFMLPSLVLYY